MRITALDTKWEHLMTLCQSESRYQQEASHPRLLKHISAEIERLAAEMGFSPRRIADREFRAERDNGRIVRVITD